MNPTDRQTDGNPSPEASSPGVGWPPANGRAPVNYNEEWKILRRLADSDNIPRHSVSPPVWNHPQTGFKTD